MTNPIRRSLCAGVAALILALTPFYLDASPGAKGTRTRASKFDDALRSAANLGVDTVPVIVTVHPADRPAVRKLLKGLGYKVKREHALISAFALSVPVGVLE